MLITEAVGALIPALRGLAGLRAKVCARERCSLEPGLAEQRERGLPN